MTRFELRRGLRGAARRERHYLRYKFIVFSQVVMASSIVSEMRGLSVDTLRFWNKIQRGS